MTYKTKLYTGIILVLMGLLGGCKYGEAFKTFRFNTAEGTWAIDYPPYMRITRHVYPGAEFQATNGYRDTYVFTRRLRTANKAGAMSDSLTAALTSHLGDPRIELDSVYTMNEMIFHTVRLTGMMKDKRMYYLTSVVDDGDRFFHFSAWMFDSKRSLWSGDYEQMLHSLRH